MNAKPVIGIVGGIGSGKSTVAAAFARHGGRVIAGDPAGHAALQDAEIRSAIARRWPDAITAKGDVDRKLLGHTVFADPKQLRELESLVFPWIKAQLKREIDAARADVNVKYIVLDAAVMLEAGWAEVCDRLIFVDAPRDIRVARVANREWTAEDLDRRERTQMSLEEKRRKCEAVIVNDGDSDKVTQQVDSLLKQWRIIPS